MVVLHFTAMADVQAAHERLCDPGAAVSAHYLIAKTGDLIALVPEDRRAWHAGAGAWGRHTDINSRSIGIELDNPGTEPFSDPLMATLERLLGGVLSRWAIPPARVIGHSDMAPGRKADPGRRFDWRRLARQGLSVWPDPAAPGDLRADLETFGYRVPPDLPDAEALTLDAFRQRFRPWATGPADDTDRALAAGLARAWPCMAG